MFSVGELKLQFFINYKKRISGLKLKLDLDWIIGSKLITYEPTKLRQNYNLLTNSKIIIPNIV